MIFISKLFDSSTGSYSNVEIRAKGMRSREKVLLSYDGKTMVCFKNETIKCWIIVNALIGGSDEKIYEGNPSLNPNSTDPHFYMGLIYKTDEIIVKEAVKNFYLGRGSVDLYHTGDEYFNYNNYRRLYNVKLW